MRNVASASAPSDRAARALAAALAFTVGCAASTATIRRTDGPPIEAEIDSSDASTLRLRGPSGNIVALDQYEVARIDHPGNILAAIGGGYTAAGILCLVPLILDREEHRMDNGFGGVVGVIGVVSLLIGLPMFVANMSVWGRSKLRAHAFEISRPPAWMIPPAVPGRAERIPPLGPIYPLPPLPPLPRLPPASQRGQ